MNLADHVHSPQCAEGGCRLLSQSPYQPGAKQYALAVLAGLVGLLLVWPLQYWCITPAVGLRYATTNNQSRGWGTVAIVFGFGVFMSLAYQAMPQVPRQVLTPWGTYIRSQPRGAAG